jgi:hypothetical protein
MLKWLYRNYRVKFWEDPAAIEDIWTRIAINVYYHLFFLLSYVELSILVKEWDSFSFLKPSIRIVSCSSGDKQSKRSSSLFS